MWPLVRTEDGSPSLVHPLHGEACHPSEGAWTQARERYAAGCRLVERLRARAPEADGRARFALLDLGTGLGLNLAAALDAWLVAGRGDVALELVTLEREREPLLGALALEPALRDAPASLRAAHAPLRAALALALERPGEPVALAGPFAGSGSSLRLLLGDARESVRALAAQRFDALFLDPFSPRVEPQLWSPDFLAALARLLASGAWLASYCAASEVRAALAAAGLRVGAGGRVGRKREGTLASPDRDPPPLQARVARRIARRAAALRAAAGPHGAVVDTSAVDGSARGPFSPARLQASPRPDLECTADPSVSRREPASAERPSGGSEEPS